MKTFPMFLKMAGRRLATLAGGAGRPETAGFVSLVGAGPGARDLITLRGVQRLREADVICYTSRRTR